MNNQYMTSEYKKSTHFKESVLYISLTFIFVSILAADLISALN